MDDEQIEDDARLSGRSKKTVVVAGLVAVLVAGVAVSFFLRGKFDDSPDTTLVNGYEVLPTITGHDPKDPFIVELSEEGRDRVREKRDDGADFKDIVSVFVDEEYTQPASSFMISTLDGVDVEPLEGTSAGMVESQGLEKYYEGAKYPHIRGGSSEEWGLYETYYVAQYVDEDGNNLDIPIVQPYTIDTDALDPVENFEISEPNEEGNVEFSWEAVDDADSYLIVQSKYWTNVDSHKYLIIGETSGTNWSSVETFSRKDGGSVETPKGLLRQNNGLATFVVHDEIGENHVKFSSDEIDEINENVQDYVVGVIATDGQRFSHYFPQEVSEELGSLPHRHADVTWEERFDFFPAGSLAELDDLTFPYVTLDGSVEETVMQIDPGEELETTQVYTLREDESGELIHKVYDVYRVPVRGVGTMLSREISVEITDDPIEDQIDEFNKAQLELAEELGIATD